MITVLFIFAILGTSWGVLGSRFTDQQDAINNALATELANLQVRPAQDMATRAETVDTLEGRVLTMATSRFERGYYHEPILYASCTPDDGKPVQKAEKSLTSFTCTAVTKTRTKGGKRSATGYKIPALINWVTGDMSWG